MVDPNQAGQVSDGILLNRFINLRDEDAFASLVERHGPLVMGVCCRMLKDIHDAEDVFQATFLVLVRKARSIAKPECLAPWLYGVAYRTAMRARSLAAKRRFHECQAAESQHLEIDMDFIWRDLRPILDEEIHRLPHSYQAPLVLCYFAGKTKEETARILGLPVGTVSSRLARAREKLRVRLTRRGLALSAGLFAGTLSSHALAASVSISLIEATTKAGLALALGQGLAGSLVSMKVISLTQEVVHSMLLSKLKFAAVGIAAALAVGSGVGIVSYRTVAAQNQKTDPTQEERLRDELARLRKALDQAEKEIDQLQQGQGYVKVSAAREGILALVGTELKTGEKLPNDQLVSVSVGGNTTKYRRLRVGDHVEAGQLLGRVDDRFARDEMKTKEYKLDAAKADLAVSEKTRDEAKARLDTQVNLAKRNATSKEDLRVASLALDRYEGEVIVKKAGVSVAEGELRQTQTVVQLHEIRSPVRGVIKAILKHPGEGVQSLETVFVIQPDEK
jgi:RNA polymerase sigma factor (sigma-70 family)